MLIGCDHKIVFSTYASARKAARRMRRKKDDVVEEYKCRECGQYHVGHPSTESLMTRKKPRKEVAEDALDPYADIDDSVQAGEEHG